MSVIPSGYMSALSAYCDKALKVEKWQMASNENGESFASLISIFFLGRRTVVFQGVLHGLAALAEGCWSSETMRTIDKKGNRLDTSVDSCVVERCPSSMALVLGPFVLRVPTSLCFERPLFFFAGMDGEMNYKNEL